MTHRLKTLPYNYWSTEKPLLIAIHLKKSYVNHLYKNVLITRLSWTSFSLLYCNWVVLVNFFGQLLTYKSFVSYKVELGKNGWGWDFELFMLQLSFHNICYNCQLFWNIAMIFVYVFMSISIANSELITSPSCKIIGKASRLFTFWHDLHL